MYFPYCLWSFVHLPQTFRILSRPGVRLSHPSPWDSPTSFPASLILIQPVPPPSFHIFLLPWIMGPTQSLLLTERLKMVCLPKTLPPPPVFSVLIGRQGEKVWDPAENKRGSLLCMIHGSARMSERGQGGCGSSKHTKKRRINWAKPSSTLKMLLWCVPEIGLSLRLVLTC